MADIEPERQLVALRFEGDPPPEGAALRVGEPTSVLTSSRRSPVLGHGVALAGRPGEERVPGRVRVRGWHGTIVDMPFYDPEGRRLRA